MSNASAHIVPANATPTFQPAFWANARTITEPSFKYTQESRAEAAFRRREQEKSNTLRRLVVVYVLVLISVVLAYTGYLIYDPSVSSDVKRFAFGIWGLVLGGVLGYVTPRTS
jgi:thiosulfate reductase cytochrome b subunit